VFILSGDKSECKEGVANLDRAFGGIGLFSFAIEQTIGMINMLIQHYGAETTLARKITASLEALQLEIGCVGSPFVEKKLKYLLNS